MKKIASLFLSLVMVLAALSFETAAAEDMTLSILLPDFYPGAGWVTLEEGNPVLQAIYKATGMKLNIDWMTSADYNNYAMVRMMAGEATEVMVLQNARDPFAINLARNGYLYDLTDLIPRYRYLSQGLQSAYSNIAIDGRIYGIYRSRAYARAGIYYRNDYAAQAGISKVPANVEEFKELCRALAGLENMYAINMCSYVSGTIGIITVMFGAPYQYGVDAEGQLYPAWEDPKFQEGLDFLRELYQIGGIDPDFMTISASNWDAAERSNPPKALMRLDCLDNGYRYEEWLEANAGVDPAHPVVTLLTALPNSEGKIQIWPQNIGSSGEIVITEMTDKNKLPAILSFLDWCNSAEGQMILKYGVEGETYWYHSDGKRYTYPEGEEENAEQYNTNTRKVMRSLSQLSMGVNGDLAPAETQSPLREWYNQNLLDNGKYVIANPCLTLDSNTSNEIGATLDYDIEAAQIMYITGQIDLDGLRSVYRNWYDQGGLTMLGEYQTEYEKTGLDRLWANKVILPDGLLEIQDEAFLGNTSLGDVVIQEGCRSIGARAFANAKGASISLPASLTAIDDTAFENAVFTSIYVAAGSYAEQWCQNKGLPTKN